MCDADNLSVATLEEAIAIRRALNSRFAATMVKVATGGEGARQIWGRGDDLEISHSTPKPYSSPRTSCDRSLWWTTTTTQGIGC